MPGAGVKILNKRIRSVKSTQQITKAMKMVAAAKLNRSQGRMLAARPYSQMLTRLVQMLSSAAEGGSPLFETREIRHRLYVVVTSDKGLAGSYNMNLLKLAHRAVDASKAEGVTTEMVTVGKKSGDYFSKRGYTVRKRHDDFNGDATAERAQRLGDILVELFLEGTFDEVRVIYAEFRSTMIQRPVDRRLLPISVEETAAGDDENAPDYIWEPSREALLAQHAAPVPAQPRAHDPHGGLHERARRAHDEHDRRHRERVRVDRRPDAAPQPRAPGRDHRRAAGHRRWRERPVTEEKCKWPRTSGS